MNEQERRRMVETANRNFEDKEPLLTVHIVRENKRDKHKRTKVEFTNRQLTVLIQLLMAISAALTVGQLLLVLLLT